MYYKLKNIVIFFKNRDLLAAFSTTGRDKRQQEPRSTRHDNVSNQWKEGRPWIPEQQQVHAADKLSRSGLYCCWWSTRNVSSGCVQFSSVRLASTCSYAVNGFVIWNHHVGIGESSTVDPRRWGGVQNIIYFFLIQLLFCKTLTKNLHNLAYMITLMAQYFPYIYNTYI